MTKLCRCGEDIPLRRAQLGYTTCLDCGERDAQRQMASWCIAPMHKSNYVLVTDKETLKQLNPKRTPQ